MLPRSRGRHFCVGVLVVNFVLRSDTFFPPKYAINIPISTGALRSFEKHLFIFKIKNFENFYSPFLGPWGSCPSIFGTPQFSSGSTHVSTSFPASFFTVNTSSFNIRFSIIKLNIYTTLACLPMAVTLLLAATTRSVCWHIWNSYFRHRKTSTISVIWLSRSWRAAQVALLGYTVIIQAYRTVLQKLLICIKPCGRARRSWKKYIKYHFTERDFRAADWIQQAHDGFRYWL